MEKTAKEKHISVLLEELTESIEIFNNKKNTIIDCTLGMWWHAEVMLSKMNPGDVFVGFDADERNIVQAEERLKNIWNGIQKIFILSNFALLQDELEKRDISSVTWIYYDLWLSSLHIDEADRWFSFRFDAPLDMRFDASTWMTAAFILNNFRREQLIEILKNYWEEPMTNKIVSAICEYRKKKKFETTFELNELILENSSIPKSNTRVFQALRIEVNKELDTLKSSLEDAIDMLERDGHIFVISFHSLEDRIVKQILKRETRDCICTDLICSCWHTKSLKVLTKKPIIPTQSEIQRNKRARSAKARCAKKL